MNKLLLTIGVIAIAVSANAQSNFVTLGDKAFVEKDYYTAANYYEKYLGIIPPDAAGFRPYAPEKVPNRKRHADQSIPTHVLYQLAESLRMLHDYANAEQWYSKTMAQDARHTLYPVAPYWHGVTLRANKKFQEAETELQGFVKSYTKADEYSEGARHELDNLAFIRQQLKGKEQSLYNVGKLNTGNKKMTGNYAPSFDGNNQLYFTAALPDTNTSKPSPSINNLYRATVSDTMISTVERAPLETTKNMDQGTPTFTADGKRMFFTRWARDKGAATAAIYMSDLGTDNKWASPVKLNDKVNLAGYSAMQPFVTPDGSRLLFASDRPNGFGKYDLWYTTIDPQGNGGEAVNLGSSINTKENEEAPFYQAISQTLVFSSDGRIGMGGYDLYKSKGDFTNWQTPVNLGYPVNSVRDDMYFYAKNTDNNLLHNAYFSSDRQADCCLEIFNVTREDKTFRQQVAGAITECNTHAPLADVQVIAADGNGTTVYKNDHAGSSYGFSITNDVAAVTFRFNKEGYTVSSEPVSIHVEKYTDTTYTVNTCLTAIPQPEKTPVDSSIETPGKETIVGKDGVKRTAHKMMKVFFEFDKSAVAGQERPVLDSLASLMQRETGLVMEIGGYTDAKGTDEYNSKLGKARAESCAAYMVQKGIERSRLVTKGYGKCCPVEPDTIDDKDNPEGRKANRRVEFKILEY